MQKLVLIMFWAIFSTNAVLSKTLHSALGDISPSLKFRFKPLVIIALASQRFGLSASIQYFSTSERTFKLITLLFAIHFPFGVKLILHIVMKAHSFFIKCQICFLRPTVTKWKCTKFLAPRNN